MIKDKFFSFIRCLSASPLATNNFITRLDTTLKEIIMNQAELKAALEQVQANQEATKTTLNKVVTEVQTLITALANTNNTLDPTVEAALNTLIATSSEVNLVATQLDALNEDTLEVPGTTS